MSKDKFDVSQYVAGGTGRPNPHGVSTAALNRVRRPEFDGPDVPTWINQITFYGASKEGAEYLRDAFLNRAKAIERISDAYDRYYTKDSSKGAGERLLRELISIIREIKTKEGK